jgi:hypothetical protein
MVNNLSGLSAQEIEDLKGALEAELKVRGPSRARRVAADSPEVQALVTTIDSCASDLRTNRVEVLAACVEAMGLEYTLRRKPNSGRTNPKEQP